jgi:CDGSH-type Zn-finger protein
MTRYYDDTDGGTLVEDPTTHFVADLYNVAYDTMLLMLLRFFAHAEESEAELEQLSRATLRLMTTVLRPLGEALAKMPVGPGQPGRTAGPGFGYNRDIHLLPHKRSAWIFFGERLRQLALATTRLRTEKDGSLPLEVEEAAAALEAMAEEFAPTDRKWTAAAEEAEFRRIEADVSMRIVPELNGPLLVSNVTVFRNCRDEPIATKPEMALCRCGQSRNKPFCDGSHSAVGFTSARHPEHTLDGVVDYAGTGVTVHYNRLLCASSERCSTNLPGVFRRGESPWIQPDRESVEAVVALIRTCPSGALRYTIAGAAGPGPGPFAEPAIRIIQNGPYEVTGIPLATQDWCAGANPSRYTLCRCGASRNKPFCDGSHWAVNFKDDRN